MRIARLPWLFIFSLILLSCERNSDFNNNNLAQGFSKDSTNFDINISIQDYHEEATSIQFEAEQIIVKAKQENCKEAEKLAQLAIGYNNRVKFTKELNIAELNIAKANDAISQSLSALSLCNDNTLSDPGDNCNPIKR